MKSMKSIRHWLRQMNKRLLRFVLITLVIWKSLRLSCLNLNNKRPNAQILRTKLMSKIKSLKNRPNKTMISMMKSKNCINRRNEIWTSWLKYHLYNKCYSQTYNPHTNLQRCKWNQLHPFWRNLDTSSAKENRNLALWNNKWNKLFRPRKTKNKKQSMPRTI